MKLKDELQESPSIELWINLYLKFYDNTTCKARTLFISFCAVCSVQWARISCYTQCARALLFYRPPSISKSFKRSNRSINNYSFVVWYQILFINENLKFISKRSFLKFLLKKDLGNNIPRRTFSLPNVPTVCRWWVLCIFVGYEY